MFKFQGKELTDEIGLYLMDFHARQYDAQLGRWHAPDPQDQFGSPYLAMGNNPVMYVDPDGEWVRAAIGAVMGAYSGYKIGQANGATGWGMFGYIAGGAAIGAISGGIGGSIAASGGFMAKTSALAFSSTYSSIGMSALSGGQTPVTTSFGAFSVDWSNGKVKTFSKDNSSLENLGFALGTMANLADLGKTGSLLLNTEKKDAINHSALKTGDGTKTLISIGPDEAKLDYGLVDVKGTGAKHYFKLSRGASWAKNNYEIHGIDQTINNVNVSTVELYGKALSYLTAKKMLPYSFVFSSCSTHTGLALNLAGIPNLFLHPYTVQASVWLWNNGVTPVLIYNSHYLQNR